MALISKSTFLEFQLCPKDTWLKLHKPELLEQFEPSEFERHLMEQGNAVEAVARGLWRTAVVASATGEDACRETERLMAARVLQLLGPHPALRKAISDLSSAHSKMRRFYCRSSLLQVSMKLFC